MATMHCLKGYGGIGIMENIGASCPFCGSRQFRTMQNDVGRWSVVCGNCEASGPTTSKEPSAIKAWLIPATRP